MTGKVDVTCAHSKDYVCCVDYAFNTEYCANCGALRNDEDPWEMPDLLKNLYIEQEAVDNE
jgi:hypothetical protein